MQPDHEQPRFGDFGNEQPALMDKPERLSIMALLSFISGLLTFVGCCIPGVGVVPVLLGVGGFIGIRASRGRVRGTGLAIAGFVLGVIALVISTAIWTGVSQAGARLGPLYAQALDPDPTVVRTVIGSSVAADLTDEQIATFRQRLADEGMTTFDIPEGLFNLLGGYDEVPTQIPPDFQTFRDPTEGGLFPLPVETDAGWRHVYVLMSPQEELGSGWPALKDIGIMTDEGIIWLVGPEDSLNQSPGESPTPDPSDTEGEPTPEDPGG